MPRSGTTLIEQILAAHPLVRGAGELRTSDGLSKRSMIFLRGGEPRRRRFSDWGRIICRTFVRARRARHGSSTKCRAISSAGLIRLILPDAKIIHSRRDPVDACLSCYSKLFSDGQNFSYDLIELGRYHRDYQILMAHWRAVLPASHFLEVDYEAVVDDVEAEARRMLEFLELPWDPACLEFYRVERPVRTASVNQVRQPIYRTSSGRWRQHADELRPLLQALGIETA